MMVQFLSRMSLMNVNQGPFYTERGQSFSQVSRMSTLSHERLCSAM